MESAERSGKQATFSQPCPPATSPFASGPAQRHEQQQQHGQHQTAVEQEDGDTDPDPELSLPSNAKIARWFRAGRALSRVPTRMSDGAVDQPAAASHVAVHVQEVRARLQALVC